VEVSQPLCGNIWSVGSTTDIDMIQLNHNLHNSGHAGNIGSQINKKRWHPQPTQEENLSDGYAKQRQQIQEPLHAAQ